ncbi:DUF423 domain-containing protein [Blastopirellula sp. JC732]|uniref:DUF423 domain-containing protein n=1 Tax=Blastopirellula sediminis TaxID=2894196 RepID=A0A9X1MMV8_9BACT|nr:DUF423 domain-containing protein [Blastopirellula sediminis]MCC9607527.1 DUF423 domain-containing protein [Blastopirellula sediminis]MCC9629180.1 DUF423 domain-containing protein [Blastopirellula sediminis]
MAKFVLVLAAICGLTGVAAGALGDHALQSYLESNQITEVDKPRERLEIGVRYQMYHAAALLGVGVLLLASDRGRVFALIAALGFLVGVLAFSGTLYYIAFTQNEAVVMLVPFGGMAYLAGWAALIIAGLQARPHGLEEE